MKVSSLAKAWKKIVRKFMSVLFVNRKVADDILDEFKRHDG